MNAGDMDRRLTLHLVSTFDDGLSAVEIFTPGPTVWASKTEVSDAERWRAGQVQASVTTRFQVRYSPTTAGLTPQDRVECEGTTYNITAIKEIGRREGIEITGAALI